MDEIAAVTAEAVAAGTERIRTFRSLSPRTRAVFASPIHSHEEPTRGVAGNVLDYTTVYDTDVLEIDGALEILEARERGGERFRFTSSVPFSAVIVDEAVAIVDVERLRPVRLRLGRHPRALHGAGPDRAVRPPLGPGLSPEPPAGSPPSGATS